MKKFEAPTLEEAYALAVEAFCCSVTELEIQIIQNPSRGLFGFGRKNAIILSESLKKESPEAVSETSAPARQNPQEAVASHTAEEEEIVSSSAETKPAETVQKPLENASPETAQTHVQTENSEEISDTVTVAEKIDEYAKSQEERKEERILARTEEMFENLYAETPDIHDIAEEIQAKVENLFATTCFKIDDIDVGVYDEETILIEFNGDDAALLIGKEGYRYKALAYLLYNWIHGTYGYRLRLEIAQFLHNQEMMIENYLEPIIQRVELEGRAQTKVLDGILVQIALTRLRELFPEKYVAVRTNREGGRYIIVNEFMERR